MKNEAKKFTANKNRMGLPEVSRTRSGQEFSPHAEHWTFRDGAKNISINFGLLPECTHQEIIINLKRVLIWYLENRAPTTSMNEFSIFTWLIRQLNIKTSFNDKNIRAEHILSINIRSKNEEDRLAKAGAILKTWVELKLPGVTYETLEAHRSRNLKHSEPGMAVATMDPRTGPLSDLEFENAQLAINAAYADGKIPLSTLLICYLCMSLGLRPGQISNLKCIDLIPPTDQESHFVLMVPRGKQKNELPRTAFRARKLSKQLGPALSNYVEDIKLELQDKLIDASQAPIFPYVGGTPLPNNGKGYEYHCSSGSISDRIRYAFQTLKLISERTGELYCVSPRRLRSTFATRAAEEGIPIIILAELLDHTDTRRVEVYSALTSRTRAQFSRSVALDMAPLAMAFMGRIIRKESEATRPTPLSRIVDLRVDQDANAMGSCGNYAHCGFARPFACYGGCYDFEPWLDGPHEAALDYMLARRQQLSTTCDERIAAVNDRSILGCAQVIIRCRQLNGEPNHE